MSFFKFLFLNDKLYLQYFGMLNEKDRYKESAVAVTGCKVQTIFISHHYVRTSERLTATKNIDVFF